MKLEVWVDNRGLADLSFRKQDHTRYLAEESPDGTITLVPLASARIPRFPLPEKDGEPAGK